MVGGTGWVVGVFGFGVVAAFAETVKLEPAIIKKAIAARTVFFIGVGILFCILLWYRQAGLTLKAS